MEWCWPEIVSSNRERVLQELTQGRDLATQLRGVLDNLSLASGATNVGSAGELVEKILASLVTTLFILKGKEPDQDHITDQTSRDSGSGDDGIDSSGGAISDGVDTLSWDASHEHAGIKSEDLEESCKSTTSTVKEEGRDSYKRRRTSHSSTIDTPTLTVDGHEWRKYGQKVIHNAKYSRSYFRCTHKFDQGCQATKHVQKLQSQPPMYRTTYFNHHICRDPRASDQLVLDLCSSPRDGSKYITFENTKLENKQGYPFFSAFKSVKKEDHLIIKEDIISHDHTVRHPTHQEDVFSEMMWGCLDFEDIDFEF